MNKVAKIAPVVIVIACIGSLVLTFTLDGRKKQLTADKAQLTKAVDTARADLGKAQQQAQQASAQLNAAQTSATQAKNELGAVKSQLDSKAKEAAGLEKQVCDLGKQLEDTKGKLTSTEQTLAKIQQATKSTDSQSADQVRTRLTAMVEENKLLSNQLVTLRDDNQRLTRELESRGSSPVNLRGSVVYVQDEWNFVVLDLGAKQQVRPDSQFLVYRDSVLVSKVQVVSVNPTTCVAEIISEYRRGTPRPGDLVIR